MEIKAFCNDCERAADEVEIRLRASGVEDEEAIVRAASQARCWSHHVAQREDH